MAVVHKKDGKFEYVYLKDVPVFWAQVHKPVKKQKSDDKEYQLTTFVSEADKETLSIELGLNKGFAQVDVDKKTKGANRGQIKYSSEKYPGMEGLFGVQLTTPELKKSGDRSTLAIAGADGKATDELIGNGSICTIKLWGYRNKEDMLNVQMQIIKVTDLVPYEGGNDGRVYDDEMGIDMDIEQDLKPDVTDDDMQNDAGDTPFDAGDDDQEY